MFKLLFNVRSKEIKARLNDEMIDGRINWEYGIRREQYGYQ